MLIALLSLLKKNTPEPIVRAPAATMRYLVPPDAGNDWDSPRSIRMTYSQVTRNAQRVNEQNAWPSTTTGSCTTRPSSTARASD